MKQIEHIEEEHIRYIMVEFYNTAYKDFYDNLYIDFELELLDEHELHKIVHFKILKPYDDFLDTQIDIYAIARMFRTYKGKTHKESSCGHKWWETGCRPEICLVSSENRISSKGIRTGKSAVWDRSSSYRSFRCFGNDGRCSN